jgi:hypothetical protein
MRLVPTTLLACPRCSAQEGTNVLLIMTDDVGFAAPSRFGGVIPTPNLDRIASSGLCSCAVLLLFGVRQRTYLSIRQPQLDPGQLFEFVGVNGHDL